MIMWHLHFHKDDELLINQTRDPNSGNLGYRKVLVCAAKKILLKEGGQYFKEFFKKVGWDGVVEVSNSTSY